jgi:pimeloyl-ACP methyl ester carboxylesterase
MRKMRGNFTGQKERYGFSIPGGYKVQPILSLFLSFVKRQAGVRGLNSSRACYALKKSQEAVMAIFVLVHGSHGGSWIWQKVTPLLRAGGHEVYTPGLTGLSDRAHLLKCGVDLTTHITDVASLLFHEDLAEVILVGNSYAGMVITGVAASIPERLKRLVYLDAYVPDDGQSELDLCLLTAPRELAALLLKVAGQAST